MLEFIKNNIATIAISILLLAIVAGIIVRLVKNKKQGKSSCGCGCSNCAMSGICHKPDTDEAKKEGK
ncbi:MAG: FeoB-associated Cys-rich membrane protein [Clostridia bacterium]|nr:FeoB-associated Cys-rich membrane protein [Clostridia bacterium]